MEKLLFIDACVRDERSRTKVLCDVYLEEFLKKNPDIEVDRVVLRNGSVETHTMEKLDIRDGLIRQKDFSHPMFDLAKQFKEADYVVIGSPYWDLSFSAILKVYIENIMMADLTFEATDTGFIGLCKGKKLTYITTAGGVIGDKNFGYDYMCGVADMLGIAETECIMAEALDIAGNDADAIVAGAIEEIRRKFK
ncbi:NAD(P)H-dependent oxidoreductase [Anaerovoracaceae bacterium 42-11]|nr:NAD(P)H-dependent oxidoreductase [Emergencia sp.]